MSQPAEPYRVAVVQAAPVFLDRDATVDKACDLIAQAGSQGARLALFPECFIPTYPLWAWFIPPGRTGELRELYDELVENAVEVQGDIVRRLGVAAREAGTHVAIGINERNGEASGTTLFNSLLLLDDQGAVVGCHRKLVPTVAERMVHGRGDGSTLAVHETSVGKLGGLICWENYMPLARYALYAWGMQILLAPTWDRGEPWLSTLRHNAKEGRVYVLGCAPAVRRDDIPDRFGFKEKYLPDVEWINPGLSAIADPDGKWVVDPVAEREEILYAEIDPANFRGPRFQLDVAGHYSRPDIFELVVHRHERPLVTVCEKPESDVSTDE